MTNGTGSHYAKLPARHSPVSGKLLLNEQLIAHYASMRSCIVHTSHINLGHRASCQPTLLTSCVAVRAVESELLKLTKDMEHSLWYLVSGVHVCTLGL